MYPNRIELRERSDMTMWLKQQRKPRRLTTLEKNVLQLRAMEMVLIIHHAQQYREALLQTIMTSENLFNRDAPRITPNSKDKITLAFALYVEDGVLTREEADESIRLLEYRNDVAHRIHALNADASDVGRYPGELRYDYDALERIKVLREKFSEQSQSRYVIPIGFDDLQFEPMEVALADGLRSLKKRIARQVSARQDR